MRKNNPDTDDNSFNLLKQNYLPPKGPIKLMPRCMFKNKIKSQQAAVSNRGHLIPCCWLDNAKTINHPIMKELLKVSKINEVEDIEQIVFSKEWQEFEKNLRERNMDKILHCCKHHCRLREDKDKLKIETHYGKTGGVEAKNIIG